MKRSISLWSAVLGLSLSWIFVGVPTASAQASPSPPPPVVQPASESLNGKSNEELVHLLVGGKNPRKLEEEERRAHEVETHLPERFGELPPKDAALALLETNCNLKLKKQLKISLRDDQGQPPDKGRVQLRLEFSYLNVPHEGLLELVSDRSASTLKFSNVELRGPVKRSRVEAAVRRTTRSPLPAEEARRLYEIIWWLGRIEFARPGHEPNTYEATTERIIVTHSTYGKLTVEPGGPRKREFIVCWAPLSECYRETFDDQLYGSFIHYLLRGALKRHGSDFFDETTAILGEETFASAEEKFVYSTKPPPPDDPGTQKWIDRMLRNLDKYPSSVISDLASIDEPLRYPDSRIDDALFRVLRDGLAPQKSVPKTSERRLNEAAHAAKALAGRKRLEAYPVIMQLLKLSDEEARYAKEDLLDAATLLAPSKPEYRQELIEYLTVQLRDFEKSLHSPYKLFDSAWRCDLREMAPVLEGMATASPEEIEYERGSSSTHPSPGTGARFHNARRILTAWREPDALTKLKLDAIIEVTSGYFGMPAELLRREFVELPETERAQASEFAQWLKGYQMKEVYTSWDPDAVVEAFAGAN